MNKTAKSIAPFPYSQPFSQSWLTLNGLRLPVHLGVSPEERLTPQYVQFEIKIKFQALPSACHSDSIHETICYANLSNILKRITENQEYALIERLGFVAFENIKETLPNSAKLSLKVLKEKPPIEELQNGASFCLSEIPLHEVQW